MNSENSASVSVLNGNGDQVLPDWTSFLADPGNGCSLSVMPDGSSDPNLTCAFSSSQLWGLQFETQRNFDQQVGGSYMIGLSATTQEPNLGDILTKFNILQGGKLPSDDGTYPVDATPSALPPPIVGPRGRTMSSMSKASTLVSDIIGNIGVVQVMQIDQTSKRNAVWLTPGQSLRTDVSLTFQPKGDIATALDAITKSIGGHGISLSSTTKSLRLVFQKTTSGVQTALTDSKGNTTNAWHVATSYSLTVQLLVGVLLFSINLKPNGMKFTVTPSPIATTKPDLLSLTGLSSSDVTPVLKDLMSAVEIFKLAARKEADNTVTWTLLMGLKLGNFDLYLSYDSLSTTFSGGLILDGFYATEEDQLLPYYDPSEAVFAPEGHMPRMYWDIRKFSSELHHIPSVLPTAIVLANISYQKGKNSNPSILSMAATLICPMDPPTTDEPKVPAPFTWDEVDIRMSIGSVFSCTLSSAFTLTTPSGDQSADLGFTISYSEPDWLLMGYADGLTGAMLFEFFDPNHQEALTSVLGKLQIPQLEVLYTYDKQQNSQGQDIGGSATSFAFVGVVQVGLLQLRLMYQYASSRAGSRSAANTVVAGDSGTVRFLPQDAETQPLQVNTVPDPKNASKNMNQTQWTFECDLAVSVPAGKSVTIGEVVDSFVDGAANFLPNFVHGIQIPSTEGAGLSPVMLKVSKFGDDQSLFAFRISLDAFSFTFAQVGNKDATKTKKMLRFAADKLPRIDGFPLFGSLSQPFDQLEYVWVNDAGGFLESEVVAINTNLLTAADSFFYRQAVGQPADKAPTEQDQIVIVPGHHFMVINSGNVILDHVFGATKASVPQNPPVPVSDHIPSSEVVAFAADKKQATNTTPLATNLLNPPTKGATEFKAGPLTISALSLQYQEQRDEKLLAVTMDADFTMGPVTFSLFGFGFGIPLQSIKLGDLTAIFGHMEPLLAGMSLDFNKPPLVIGGGFEHQKLASGDDIFLGGIAISFPPYTFIGLGEYAIMNGYKSVFLYAKLDGRLVTLAFATISGVRLGFGYNSFVRPPAIREITQFPFIDDRSSAGATGAGNNPMQIVKNMTQAVDGQSTAWVTPKLNSYWFAAGMTVQAFDVLTVTAVALLAFRDAGVIINIYADAIAQMPPDAPDRSAALVYVELEMVAEMNFIDGYFRVEAALAPTSFLLVPQCHLYGGFALVYWFDPNPHAGDWVFSVGGYHPRYSRPDWYPALQRLGISFNVGSCLSITGESYFAVTPKTVMGGALIHASLSLGPINAWLDAGFDCLINFHPLFYMADFHVAIGVNFDVDFWFIHIHISCSVGAWLSIQGPQFGGTAHVDFYLFGFDVDFGASPEEQPAKNLLQFWELLHSPGPAVESQEKPDPKRLKSFVMYDKNLDLLGKPSHQPPEQHVYEGAALKFALEDGNFNNPPNTSTPVSPTPTSDNSDPTSTGQGVKWCVKAGTFKFRVATDLPISHAIVAGGSDGSPPIEIPNLDEKPAPLDTGIYSKPMRVTDGIVSELTVTVKFKTSGELVGRWTHVAFDIKAVPWGTFGKYDITSDPSKSDASVLLDPTGGTMPLPMGLIVAAPLPHLAESLIGAFKASDASKLAVVDFRLVPKVFSDGVNWFVPRFTPQDPDPKAIGIVLAPQQNIFIPDELNPGKLNASNQQKWDDMGQQWTELATQNKTLVTGNVTGLLATCASVLGWNQRVPISAASPTASATASAQLPWQLVGTFPEKLVRSQTKAGVMVKNLEATYLVLPRIAVVS